MRTLVVCGAALAALAAAARAEPAHDASPEGLAIGVEAGEPSSATVGWFGGALGGSLAVGSGTLAGPGLSLHADVVYQPMQLTRLGGMPMPLLVGVGVRYYHHGYQPMSIDEIPDTHVGVRASVALGLDHHNLRFYAELSPGVDVHRSASCNLQSGVDSVCPHAQSTPVFVELVVGARWFLR